MTCDNIDEVISTLRRLISRRKDNKPIQVGQQFFLFSPFFMVSKKKVQLYCNSVLIKILHEFCQILVTHLEDLQSIWKARDEEKIRIFSFQSTTMAGNGYSRRVSTWRKIFDLLWYFSYLKVSIKNTRMDQIFVF